MVDNPLLALGMIILGGYLGGKAAKALRLPSIIGNIGAGVLLGSQGLGLLEEIVLERNLSFFNDLALGFIALSVAFHLNLEELKELSGAPFLVALLETTLSLLVVAVGFYWVTGDLPLSLMAGVMASTTAPATGLAVVKEVRAKGPFVSVLLPTIAFDNLLAILFFTLAVAYLGGGGNLAFSLSIPVAIGLGVGSILTLFHSEVLANRRIAFMVGFLSLMVVSGLAQFLRTSPFLAALSLGFSLTNSKEIREEMAKAFREVEPLIYLVFFTMAGTHLKFHLLLEAKALVALFVVGRFVGKFIGGILGSRFSPLPFAHRWLLGFGLLPQAGLALGFLVVLGERPQFEGILSQLAVVVLSAIVVNEILGPLALRYSLRAAREEGKAVPKALGIFDEGDIYLDLEAQDKWEAISKLVRFLCQRQCLDVKEEGRFLQRVLERELSMTTGIGHGIALPHGIIPKGNRIMGVMGISYKGVDFQSMDGRPAHVIILTLVPEDRIEEHLEFLRNCSKVFSKPFVLPALLESRTPEEALEVILEASNA